MWQGVLYSKCGWGYRMPVFLFRETGSIQFLDFWKSFKITFFSGIIFVFLTIYAPSLRSWESLQKSWTLSIHKYKTNRLQKTTCLDWFELTQLQTYSFSKITKVFIMDLRFIITCNTVSCKLNSLYFSRL